MNHYARCPTKRFVMFQNGNRRALLQRKGAISDYQRNFIEISGSADERDGDLHLFQIMLFLNGDEPWCAVVALCGRWEKCWARSIFLMVKPIAFGFKDARAPLVWVCSELFITVAFSSYKRKGS